jgi:ABC-type oligopeptide transport system substrate-binding subunit
MRTTLALAALAALALTACNNPTGSAPQGSDTAAAMPDTSAPKSGDATMAAPDAGATGAVPSENAPTPQVAPEPATPPGTAGDGKVDAPK